MQGQLNQPLFGLREELLWKKHFAPSDLSEKGESSLRRNFQCLCSVAVCNRVFIYEGVAYCLSFEEIDPPKRERGSEKYIPSENIIPRFVPSEAGERST